MCGQVLIGVSKVASSAPRVLDGREEGQAFAGDPEAARFGNGRNCHDLLHMASLRPADRDA